MQTPNSVYCHKLIKSAIFLSNVVDNLCINTSPQNWFLYSCVWQNFQKSNKTDILGDWIDADTLGCYKFLDDKINHTWVEALYECEQIGGYLAEPTTHR